MKLTPLTPDEEKTIINKETEKPFSGEYDNFFENGLYICRRCNASLYRSENKFDAHCGWPSFDEEIAGAVINRPDPDGIRTEIICARCSAHLGHVFVGEKLTSKNTRHCVNSISMKFISANNNPTIETIYFGGGCFWCTEAIFKMINGVVSVTPGYAGGETPNPTYKDVAAGTTGHAEVIKVIYDNQKISLEGLLEIFFLVHDPTTPNRQGNDVGTQYRSIILYELDWQKEVIENFIARIKKESQFKNSIVTELKLLEKFYPAEDYHKDYYQKNFSSSYCRFVISPKLDKLKKSKRPLIR